MIWQASAWIVPPRPIPVSTSTWIGARMPALRACFWNSRAKPRSETEGVRLYLMIWSISESVAGERMRIGGRDPAHAELHPLVGVCHAEAGGAVLQGGVGDLDRPVAVGVRLDHLHDLHAGADQPLHLRPVRGEVAEIDLDPTSVFQIFLQRHRLKPTPECSMPPGKFVESYQRRFESQGGLRCRLGCSSFSAGAEPFSQFAGRFKAKPFLDEGVLILPCREAPPSARDRRGRRIPGPCGSGSRCS